MFTTKRERLYGGPLSRGAKFHYVTYLKGRQVGTGGTKEESQENAANALLGAEKCQTSFVYASVCSDGAVLTTREYAPGEIEQAFHRPENDARGGGISMGRCTISGIPVSVYEYHMHRLEQYNA